MNGKLDVFKMMHKFPRIAHCPWSENISGDDKLHPNMSIFEGQNVAATIKMDGECTTIAPDYIHTRSLDYHHHDSRTWMKQFWSITRNDIPEGYQISGENLFAKHSIHYHHLKSFFYVYTIINEEDIILSWDFTKQWCDILGLTPVTEFFRGVFSRHGIHVAFDDYCRQSKDLIEGYVIRLSKEISLSELDKNRCFRSYCKWVRKYHVTTDKHWMSQPIIPNELEKT
jgi:hypothetical protein